MATGLTDYGPVPVSENAGSDESSGGAVPVQTPQLTAAFEANEQRVTAMIKRFRKDAPKMLRKFPSMLTEGDKALYFDAARKFQFKGAIVDGGCFVGGTTMSLVQGLLQNPLIKKHDGALGKLIRVYDLFEIDDSYILEHLKKNYPKHDFTNEKSFLGVFQQNMQKYADMLDVRPGDVIQSGYHDEDSIEILGVDLCKALPVTDFVVRTFFPRLLVGAKVMQQDFIHQYHPHIHLSMLLLEDYFDLDLEIKWGGSVSYTLKKVITPDVITAKFGKDTMWYHNVPRNEMLLRKLEKNMLYDENKWVIMQVLGIYFWAMNEPARASAVYQDIRQRFPQFDIPDEVRRLISGEKS